MQIQNRFKRVEMKFILNDRQTEAVKRAFSGKMKADEYGKTRICNVYYDTPNFRLIRKSIEQPVYKEKLRVRSYGTPKYGDEVFIELKKKYDGIVYKRREKLPLEQAEKLAGGEEKFLCDEKFFCEENELTQVEREIKYFSSFYGSLCPAVYLAYVREAFYSLTDPNLRITFDTDILWRDENVNLTKGVYGTPVLPRGKMLMEIKTDKALPLWLTKVLSEEKIYKTSFSKYGEAYKQIAAAGGGANGVNGGINNEVKGDKIYARVV